MAAARVSGEARDVLVGVCRLLRHAHHLAAQNPTWRNLNIAAGAELAVDVVVRLLGEGPLRDEYETPVCQDDLDEVVLAAQALLGRLPDDEEIPGVAVLFVDLAELRRDLGP